MVDQLRRTIPIKFDLGSIITLIVVVCTMVWNFAHTNASVEETRQSIEQIRQANDSNRVSADVRMNGLETKIDRLYDKQGEANVSIGKVQSDIQNLRDRITFGQGEQQGEGAKRFPH